jgi:hypothetical protein
MDMRRWGYRGVSRGRGLMRPGCCPRQVRMTRCPVDLASERPARSFADAMRNARLVIPSHACRRQLTATRRPRTDFLPQSISRQGSAHCESLAGRQAVSILSRPPNASTSAAPRDDRLLHALDARELDRRTPHDLLAPKLEFSARA